MLVLASVPVAAASASYDGTIAYSSKAAPEAKELSGLVASPTYPNWYWAQSDIWKSTDTFSACAGLVETELRDCRQIQRARLWALRLDPVTHEVKEVRSFALADPSWALDPHLAQNNDWEELVLGPVRTSQDGTTSQNLILAATGYAVQNRVIDADGRDITCDTRRLLELDEPNLADPTAATWSPWKIYDLKNYVGTNRISQCNIEAVVTAEDVSGTPQAYMVTKGGQKILRRSLEVSTGRDPDQAYVAPGTGEPYDPSVAYVGVVKGAAKLTITAAASNGTDVALQVPKTRTRPCQVLHWQIGSDGLVSTLTTTAPTVAPISCTLGEGLTYIRDPQDISVFTRDLMLMADTGSSSRIMRYWYLPWTP